MATVLENAIASGAPAGLSELAGAAPAALPACFHCGERCRDYAFVRAEKVFCCLGCRTVHDLLAESGLGQFYELSAHPGARVPPVSGREAWACLDDPELQQKLLDFTDGAVSRVTFHIPAIHCVACVWLLENLFQLHAGIGKSQVNFPRREVAISFAPERVALSEVVALLASIGYPPQLTLGELEKPPADPSGKRRWLQVGVAGFAFGNIMLLSIPSYLGLDQFTGPFFRNLFGVLSLLLALPVLVYSAADYWRSAWLSVRQRVLTLDVPIALGLAALYAQSALQISTGRGEGYLDSLAGLVFFLLCGRAFQRKTYERLAFDRDYKCFFPLSVHRLTAGGQESVALSKLRVGDRLRVRNGELIPADARLLSDAAWVDYSFVTGESEPIPKQRGDYLYAGGRQVGSAIEIETVKPVSQSYLTSLWNSDAFRKQKTERLDTLTDRYSRWFTRLVIAVAMLAALFWALSGSPSRGLKAFTSILIVACPCALALAAPFALGTAQRLLARRRVFLKNSLVLDHLARITQIVFDKTGTLTAATQGPVSFHGERTLGTAERSWVAALAAHSTHPHAARIAESLKPDGGFASAQAGSGVAALPLTPARIPSELPLATISAFAEVPGSGISGEVAGHAIHLGSRAWLEAAGATVPTRDLPQESASYLAIDGAFRGAFVLANALRPEADHLLHRLGQKYELALLSGDNERERERFQALFGPESRVHFNQSPLDKLGFIRALQASGRRVMMVGDGLNDAGALRQSDVGVAVVEKVGAFSPASDIILDAAQVPELFRVLALARASDRIVRVGLGISAAYNLVGIGFAAAGLLSPLICAVLMPLSSVSVVLFACGATAWAAKREAI